MKILGACARVAESATWGAVEGLEVAFCISATLRFTTQVFTWDEQEIARRRMQCACVSMKVEQIDDILPYIQLIGAVAGAYFGAVQGIVRELHGDSNGALIG